MKKKQAILLYFISLLNTLTMNGQNTVEYKTPRTEGGTEVACTSIRLLPGFSFKAKSGSSLSLKVDYNSCKPYSGEKDNFSVTRNSLVKRSYINKNGYLDEIQYYDGLGRLTETIFRGITPLSKDLVSLQEYDNFGLESNLWTIGASTSSTSGGYIDKNLVKNQIYSSLRDSKPYSSINYEMSPLSRISKQFGVGSNWTDIPVEMSYSINNQTPEGKCIQYKVEGSRGNPTLKKIGISKSGELEIVKTEGEGEGEDRSVIYEFKDKLGQVVMTRQKNKYEKDAEENLDTYYVYDDYGNLCFVLPPLTDGKIDENNLNLYAYRYKYDTRNRCISKKLPGADWINYVYDKADRLIFSQDGEQALKKEWTFNMYDVFGRLIISGIYRTGSTHQAMISSYSGMLFNESVGGGNFGYTWNILPTISVDDVLLVNYYDNSNTMLNAVPYYKTNLAYKEQSGYGTRNPNEKGLLVGTRVKNFNPDGTTKNSIEGQIAIAMYYDNKGNLIQSHSTNHLGGIDSEYTAYTFTGQPTQKKLVHTASGKATQTEVYTYTYDHAGRLTKTAHSLNGAGAVLLAQNTYDEQGRLQTTMANNAANTKVSYDYNIRSWTKAITNNHFIENLEYTYSGNINKQIWKQSNRTNQYIFAYDNLSRLKSATYTGTSGNYTTGYTYDGHGNVQTIQRNGLLNGGKSYGLIDNMTFAYTGNQLKKITDSAPNLLSASSTDFKNGANADIEYQFNANGAMIQDLNKGIKSISYNSLNLPRQMVIENQQAKGTNLYTYTATGQKLRVIHQSADMRQLVPVSGTTLTKSTENKTTQKDYIGNKIYENSVLKQIQLGNGYIEGGKYYFYIKDHLGNNRIVANASGGVEESNEYYPFGGLFAQNTDLDKQDFKYNGKEYDSMHGLNQYDYAARHYDPAYARFTTMDPHSENYYSWSPYAYVANNPMKLIDPTGKDWFVNNEDGNLFFLKGVSELTQEHREKYNLGTASYERIGSGDDAMGIGVGYKKNTFEDNGKTYTFNTFPKKGDADYNSSSLLLDQDFVALYGESEDIASRQGLKPGIRGTYKETLFEYTSAGFSEPAGISPSTTPQLIGKEQRTYTYESNLSVKKELDSRSFSTFGSSSTTSIYTTIRPLNESRNNISYFTREKIQSYINQLLSTLSSFY